MKAFNLTAPTLNPSYENAIQAGSLSHTGNSFRPIGAPVKRVGNIGSIQPISGTNTPSRPVANPVRVTQGINGGTQSTLSVNTGSVATVPVREPQPVGHGIRGIYGQ